MGRVSLLRRVEKAFNDGVILHPFLHGGRSANSTSNLSSQWVGGQGQEGPRPSTSGSAALGNYTIPLKSDKGVTFQDGNRQMVKMDPRSWERLEVEEEPAFIPSYTASDEAMSMASRLFLLKTATVEKKVKDWSHEYSMMPTPQWNQLRLTPLPPKFESVAKFEPVAKAREKALMAVGHALNYVTMATIRLSELVMALDELIPDLEIKLAALNSAKPPIYLSPADRATAKDVKCGMKEDQRLFVDPLPAAENKDHTSKTKT